MVRYIFTKVGLISESFSCWLQCPKKCAKNYSDLYPPKEQILRIGFGIFWGDLSQNENFFEIKLPLIWTAFEFRIFGECLEKADQCKSAESERNRCVLVQEGLYQPWQQSFVGHFALRWPKHFARFPQTIRLGYYFLFFLKVKLSTFFMKLFPSLSICWVARRVRVKKYLLESQIFWVTICLFVFTLTLLLSSQ